MTAKIIDGKALAARIQDELKTRVEACTEHGHRPGLAVVLVGEDPASQVYVRNKIKACSDVGITSKLEKLPAETSEAELLALLEKLNADDSVDGILVQLPLPRHINEQKVIETIRADKDVDGFHVANVGSVVTGIGGFRSCTPYGVIKMLESVDYPLTGAHALVIGRSNIVGKPMAALLLRENGTVTVAHSRTKNLADVTRRADILIVAIGKERFITSDYVKEGAVVIDVGIHRNEQNKLCGDVDRDDVMDLVSAITPVPGGVGPMTIAMLMYNCVEAVRLQKTER